MSGERGGRILSSHLGQFASEMSLNLDGMSLGENANYFGVCFSDNEAIVIVRSHNGSRKERRGKGFRL